MRLPVLAIAAFAVATPAMAQQHAHTQTTCLMTDEVLPPGLGDWNGEAAIATASTADQAVTLTLGKGYQAALLKRDSVAFVVEPEKPGGSVSYSGIFVFDATTAGTYTVALSTAAWIDMVEDGKALEPLSFGHGPQCTTIRKMVVYPLQAGRHVLQIAGNGAETAKLMVAKQP